jgi:hypothetical protein
MGLVLVGHAQFWLDSTPAGGAVETEADSDSAGGAHPSRPSKRNWGFQEQRAENVQLAPMASLVKGYDVCTHSHRCAC